MEVTKFGEERLAEEGFDEFCAGVLALNGVEGAHFYIACMLAEGPMGEITCGYREVLEFVETNNAVILPHLISTTNAAN